MILSIGKPVEFDEHDLPQPGQCLPHTNGWQLKITENGQSEVLHTDTLYNCRRILAKCEGLENVAEIMDCIENALREIEQDFS